MCVLPVHITYARSSIASYQSATFPQARMQSTGMSVRPINATPTLNSYSGDYGASSTFSPARTISAQNFADLQNTGSTTSGLLKPHIRRVSGEDDDDDPTNPYIDGNYTPIGDAILPLLLCVMVFVLLRKKRLKKA